MNIDTVDLKEYLEKKWETLSFGVFIRSMRELQGITQVKMAKSLGISKSMLCDIEKERQVVSPALAAKFAIKCKIPVKSAVQLVLQDQIRAANLKFTVRVA